MLNIGELALVCGTIRYFELSFLKNITMNEWKDDEFYKTKPELLAKFIKEGVEAQKALAMFTNACTLCTLESMVARDKMQYIMHQPDGNALLVSKNGDAEPIVYNVGQIRRLRCEHFEVPA